MKIKRYINNDTGMAECVVGPWVRWGDYKWMADYADLLVHHSSMVCLPKDLENLREANSSLAEENHRLKAEIEELKAQPSILKAKAEAMRERFKDRPMSYDWFFGLKY